MQCVFCNCAKKGLGWCRKKRKMPAMEEEKKTRPLLGGLSWLPISTGLLAILTCVVTYTIAVLSNHIMVVLPYVSDAGMHYPESSIFSLCLNIVVSLLMTTLVVRYYLLAECPLELEPKARFRYKRVNKSSLVVGCLSAFGLAILSNFPLKLIGSESKEDENLTIHLIGAFFCFLFGVMYGFMHAWLSFQGWSTITNPYVCIIRLALASFGAADLIMVILFGSGLRWYATKDNPVLHFRRISAAFEWMLVVKLNVYFMTFSHEFRHIKLFAQLQHWRGNQWEPIEGSIGTATPATESVNEDDVEVKIPRLDKMSTQPGTRYEKHTLI